MRKRNYKLLKSLITLAVFLALFGVGILISSYYQLSKINHVKLSNNNEDLGIKEGQEPIKDSSLEEGKAHKVTNILFLGVDDEEKASDSIMVLTIDDTTKKVKLTSIMRDSYVFFGKDKINKINYAYHYGGVQQSVKTVNESFSLDIRDYIKVDFASLDKIIDSIGGVDIEVKKEELSILNAYVRDIARIEKTQPTELDKTGLVRLNGQQAVAYSRIRYVGNMDYERTERQRRVLKALFDRMKDISPLSIGGKIGEIAHYLETSLDKQAMVSLALKLVPYGRNGIQESRVPYDGYKSDDMINGIYYMQWDKEKNTSLLHKFIYFE